MRCSVSRGRMHVSNSVVTTFSCCFFVQCRILVRSVVSLGCAVGAGVWFVCVMYSLEVELQIGGLHMLGMWYGWCSAQRGVGWCMCAYVFCGSRDSEDVGCGWGCGGDGV